VAASDFDFSLTRDQIVQGALRKVGALPFGEPLNADEANNAASALNQLVKEWQTKNIFLWQLLPSELSVVGNTQPQVTIDFTGVFPLGIDAASWSSDGGITFTPLQVISWRDYNAISDRSSRPGDPEKIAFDNIDSGQIFLYPVRLTTYTLRCLFIQKLKDWDSASGGGDLPAHWSLALQYGLADLLADDYGLPLSERQALGQKASYYFTRAKGSNRDRADRNVVKGAFDL
jgi:hypothetical protein